MSARLTVRHGAMVCVALWGAAAVTAAAQTVDPQSAVPAAKPHRIVLPLPKSEQATPVSTATPAVARGASVTAPAALDTPRPAATLVAENTPPAGNPAADTTTPSQAAAQAAIAALTRDMEALRHGSTAAGGGVAAAKPAGMQPMGQPITGVSRPAPDTVTSVVSPRAADVLGNLAPAAATTGAAAPAGATAAPVAAAAAEPAAGVLDTPPVQDQPEKIPAAAAAAQPDAGRYAAPVAAEPAMAAPMSKPQASPAAVAAPPAVRAGAARSMPATTTASIGPAPIVLPISAPAAAAAGMMGNFSNSEPVEQVLHVRVGRSVFIDTRHRLTRIYVTDPAILNSYTANPNQIVVTALKAGSSTVMVWDEAGETQSYVISADLNVEALQRALTQGFPLDAIHVEGSEDRLVLSGYVATEDDAVNAGKLSMQFSKMVTNTLVVNSSRVKQVRLKVRIVEVDRSKLAQFGFSFFSQGGKNVATTSTGQFASSISGSGPNATISNPLNFSLYSSKLNVGATLEDLATQNIAQILAEPTITAMSGQKANFLAGGQFPFPVVQASGGSTAASVTLQFMPYGVKLEFMPKVNPDGTIDLKVAPEVSALDYSNAVTLAGYTVPAISTRRADTELVLESGQSFAISGLLDQRVTDILEHAPGIASVPILGELFKSKSVNHSVGELVVLVTPTLVDPVAEAKAAEDAIPQPKMVVPFVDKQKFDSDLPKREKKQQ